jgi:ATP-dependent RNA helicase DDX24/MAK5
MTVDADNDEQRSDVADILQTFVLSATLSKDLQRNLKRRSRPKPNNKRKHKDDKPASTLGMYRLMMTLLDKMLIINCFR